MVRISLSVFRNSVPLANVVLPGYDRRAPRPSTEQESLGKWNQRRPVPTASAHFAQAQRRGRSQGEIVLLRAGCECQGARSEGVDDCCCRGLVEPRYQNGNGGEGRRDKGTGNGKMDWARTKTVRRGLVMLVVERTALWLRFATDRPIVMNKCRYVSRRSLATCTSH